jgi:hypothetical protein
MVSAAGSVPDITFFIPKSSMDLGGASPLSTTLNPSLISSALSPQLLMP